MFLHYNGRYHSDNHQSIIWYLNKYAPGKEMKTISCVLADDYQVPEEEKGVADFIIVIPASMTRTY
jgi:hypothetical protein